MKTVPFSRLAPVLAATLLLALPGTVRADDTPAPPASPPAAPATDALGEIKQLQIDIEAATKAKDDGAMTTLAKKMPPLYKSTQDTASRSALMKSMVGMLKNPKMSSARAAALYSIVDTEDGKEAWKAMASLYPADDLEDPEKFNEQFIEAVGKLHPDAAIDKLLETFKKAKAPDVSAKAASALGMYHKSKQRERIFEELVKSGRNMVPSKSANANPSPETQARWAAVAPKLGKALDELTGDTVGDPLEWFKRYNDAKKNLKILFKD